MRIQVITSCTGQKAIKPDRIINFSEFKSRDAWIAQREREAGVLTPAEDLYTGQQHIRLMRGVRAARQRGAKVDVQILSAGYGLIPGGQPIATYEASFAGIGRDARARLATAHRVHAAMRRALAEPVDLRVILLGDLYLDACEPIDALRATGPTLALCSATSAPRFPTETGIRPIPLSEAHTRRFGAGFVALKGEVAGRLLPASISSPNIQFHPAGRLLAELADLDPTDAAPTSGLSIKDLLALTARVRKERP